MSFKIRVAKSAGFCFGVRRALDLVLAVPNDPAHPVRTLGPLIHNPQVIDILRSRGIDEFDPDENLQEQHVVIRAHGVPPEKRLDLKAKHVQICNATCPRVARVQGIVKKYSRKNVQVVIVGDVGHSEVDGILGYSGYRGIAVSGPDDVAAMTPGKTVCIVAQTTQDRHVFNDTVAQLKEKFEECFVFDTICDATSRRQTDVHDLADVSDLVIVIGGKNSANTRRLADIASKITRTVMIQSEKDLTWDLLKDARNVGISAGASTPNWVIQDVIQSVRRLERDNSRSVWEKYLLKIAHLAENTGISFVLSLCLISGAVQLYTKKPFSGLLIIPVLAAAWIFREYPDPSVIRRRKQSTVSWWSRMSKFLIPEFVRAGMIASIAVLLPAWNTVNPAIYMLWFYLVCLLLLRDLMFEMRSSLLSRISGTHSAVVLLGTDQSRKLMIFLGGFTALIPVIFYPSLSVLSLIPILYLIYLVVSFHRLEFLGITRNITMDAGLWLTASILWLNGLLP